MAQYEYPETHDKVLKRESGGRDYDAQGNPLRSSAGALFGMQVMPGTAGSPGFGIMPARAATAEEYNRVGHEYLDALMRKYQGDERLAMMAYNWGPGNVDKWIRSGADPSAVPAETRKYVRGIDGAEPLSAKLPQQEVERKYSVETPSGRKYTVQAISPEVAWAWANQYEQEEDARKAQRPGFFKSFGEGVESTTKGAYEAGRLAISPEDAAREQKMVEEAQKPRYTTEGFINPFKAGRYGEGISELLGYAKQTAGESLGAMAPAMAAGSAAAAATPPVLPVVGPFAKPVVGGIATLGALAAGQFGSNVQRQAVEREAARQAGQTPQEFQFGRAGTAAVGQAGLDMITLRAAGLQKLFGFSTEKAAAVASKELAQEGVLKSLGIGTLRTGAAEIPTEVSQQALERWQAGLPLEGSEAVKEYRDAAIGAGILSPLFGLPGRRMEVGGARRQLAEQEQAAAAAQAAQAAQTPQAPQPVEAPQAAQAALQNAEVAAGASEAAQTATGDFLTKLNTVEGIDDVLGNLNTYFSAATPKERAEFAKDLKAMRKDLVAKQASETKMAEQSAFANAPLNMFGEPAIEGMQPREQEVAQPEEVAPVAAPEQQTLGLEEPLQPLRFTSDLLRQLKIPKNSRVYANLLDRDMHDPADVATINAVLENSVSDKSSGDFIKKIEAIRALVAQEQPQAKPAEQAAPEAAEQAAPEAEAPAPTEVVSEEQITAQQEKVRKDAEWMQRMAEQTALNEAQKAFEANRNAEAKAKLDSVYAAIQEANRTRAEQRAAERAAANGWGEAERQKALDEEFIVEDTRNKEAFAEAAKGTQGELTGIGAQPADVDNAPSLKTLLEHYIAAREQANVSPGANYAMRDIEDLAKELYGRQWSNAKYDALMRKRTEQDKTRQAAFDFEGASREEATSGADTVGLPETGTDGQAGEPSVAMAEQPGVGQPAEGTAAPVAGGVGVSEQPAGEPDAREAGKQPALETDPAALVRKLQAISAAEKNSDLGQRARLHLKRTKVGDRVEMDAAAAFLVDYSEAKRKAKVQEALDKSAARDAAVAWKRMAEKGAPEWTALSDAQRAEWTELNKANRASMHEANRIMGKPQPKAKTRIAKELKAAAAEVEKEATQTEKTLDDYEKEYAAELDRDEPRQRVLDALERKIRALSLKRRALTKAELEAEAAVPEGEEVPSTVAETGWENTHKLLKDENTLGDALNTLLRDGNLEPDQKALVTALLRSKSVQSASFSVVAEDKFSDGIIQGGGYNPATNMVRLYNKGGTVALLHEAVHSAVYGSLATDTAFRAQITELFEKAKAQLAAGEHGLNNVQEFVAEAFTNTTFQKSLASLSSTGNVATTLNNLWSKFVSAIRNLLGLPETNVTLLDDVLSAVAPHMTRKFTPVFEAEAPSVIPASTQAMLNASAPQQRTAMQQLLAHTQGATSLGTANAITDGILKARTAIMDRHATIEHRFTSMFNGAVRTALGKVNPIIQLRQAEDVQKMMLEFFKQGSVVFDQVNKLWRVTTDANVPPPAAVYDLVQQWAKQQGKSFEKAKYEAGRILEAYRLHNLRLADSSVLSHMSNAEIDALVAVYNADPLLQQMTAHMDKSRIAMVNHMEAVGRLTPEMAAEWRDVVGYVPFDRLSGIDGVESILRRPHKRTGRGLAQIGKLPELIGSLNRPVKNSFDNYINTMGWMLTQTVRTDAVRSTLSELQQIGMARDVGSSQPHTVSPERIVKTYIGGEERFFELPTAYDAAAFNDRSTPLPTVFKWMAQISHVLRTTITAIPTFSAKQIVEDVQRAAIYSGVKDVGKLTRYALRNFKELSMAEITGTTHPTMQQFGEIGLTGEFDWMNNDPAASLARDLGFEKRHLLGSTKLGNLLHKLDGITRSSDLAIRKAIYDVTMEENNNDMLLAQTRAREIINFRRRGAGDRAGVLNIMIQTVPFFNAYLQGLDNLYRAATGVNASSSMSQKMAARFFISRVGTLAAMSTMYAMMGGGDDEAYDKMALDKRDKSWVLGGGVVLPVPTEIGIIFKALPERVWEYFRRAGTPEEQTASEAITSYMRAAADTYAGRLIPLPQAMRPFAEVITNHSFLTGRPIEGIHQKEQLNRYKVNSTTSELAQAVAKYTHATTGLDISPLSVDTVLNGYFGTTAALVTATTDAMLNPDKPDRPLHKMVGLASFTYDPVGTRPANEFYDLREVTAKTTATFNDLKVKNPMEAVEFAKEHQAELFLNTAVNQTLRHLSETRKYRDWLSTEAAAQQMSSQERADKIEEVRRMEQQYVQWVRSAKHMLGL